MIDCHHYQKGNCRSCQWLEMPYEQQLAKKEEHLKQQLAKLDCDNLIWHPSFYSLESAFRNKAKMVVSGAVERPILTRMIHKVRWIYVIVRFIHNALLNSFRF